MSTFSKIVLSGSTAGHGIIVSGVDSAAAITVHAPDDTDTDEIWVWADSSHTASLLLELEFGGVTNPQHVIHQTIYPDLGLQLVVPGLIIVADAAPAVEAFCATVNQIALFGYVIRETA